MMDAEEIYDRYFKEILENPDGTMDMQALKNELHDLFLISSEYAQIFRFVSDGVLANGVRNHLGDELEAFLRDGQ